MFLVIQTLVCKGCGWICSCKWHIIQTELSLQLWFLPITNLCFCVWAQTTCKTTSTETHIDVTSWLFLKNKMKKKNPWALNTDMKTQEKGNKCWSNMFSTSDV